MSKLAAALQGKKVFAPFITAGDPDLETTKKLILALEKAGASLVELGIPFSDPMAEGPVIQAADLRALSNGCTTDKVFDMVAEVRKETDIPLVFLTYANPIFHYGTEKFYRRCAETGVDGTIVPDVPYEEREELEGACRKYGVDRIVMIAPTSDDRIQMLAKDAKGYIYIVSSLGVTGVRSEITTDIASIYKRSVPSRIRRQQWASGSPRRNRRRKWPARATAPLSAVPSSNFAESTAVTAWNRWRPT